MDYCDVISHQAAKILREGQVLTTLMNEVERVQYRAALAVTGAWKGSSRSKLYDELGWESLSDRRNKQRQVLLFKIINNPTLTNYLLYPIHSQTNLFFTENSEF